MSNQSATIKLLEPFLGVLYFLLVIVSTLYIVISEKNYDPNFIYFIFFFSSLSLALLIFLPLRVYKRVKGKGNEIGGQRAHKVDKEVSIKSINGTGTMFFGVFPSREQGISIATIWYTLLWIPLAPRKRVKVRFEATSFKWFLTASRSSMKFTILEETPLIQSEVHATFIVAFLKSLLCLVSLVLFAFAGFALLGVNAPNDLLSQSLFMLLLLIFLVAVIKILDLKEADVFQDIFREG